MKAKNILICLTASFPYGKKETFFENELPYLSENYDVVVIIPTYNPSSDMKKRDVPSNVITYPPSISNNKFERIVDGISFSYSTSFLRDFFEQKVYKSATNVKRFLNSYFVFQKSYKNFRKIKDKHKGNVTLYSYWAEAPLFFTRECAYAKKVIRMHRIDFYLDVNNGYLPVRKKIYDNADLLLPISNDISSILKKEYDISDQKIFVNHLGIDNPYGRQEFIKNENVIRIVSCSRVDPVKRVDLIAECMFQFEGEGSIEWHHFGDGTEFKQLQKIVSENLNNKVKVILHGWADQKAIYDFYFNNTVHWFINLSLHEGVPVSIMEAISFGIPVIATNVGATRECVNNNNGFIIPVSCNPSDVIAKILTVDNAMGYLAKRDNAYTTWNDKFVANKNYESLVKKLKEIRELKYRKA